MPHSSLFRQLRRTFRMACYQNLKADGGHGRPTLKGDRPPTKLPSRWSRRRFLKSMALAGGAAIATRIVAHPHLAWGTRTPQVAVIGAGIAGLNAAYQLKKAGLTATVYEARHRVGGRIQSATGVVGEGIVSDLGGHFINTDHLDMIALAEEFGINLFNLEEDAAGLPIPSTTYYFGGRSRSEQEVAELLRPLAEQIMEDAIRLDEDFDRVAVQLDRRSVAEYLDQHRDKISDPFIRVLIENTIRTEYGAEPKDSSALQLIFNLPIVGDDVEVLGASDEVFAVEGGAARITDALANALTGQIRLGKQLVKIQGLGQNGFRLDFANNETVRADFVIVAIPLTTLRQVALRSSVPNNLRRFIRNVGLGSNEKILAGYETKVWRRQDGFSQEVWTDLGFSQAWDGSQRQSDRDDGELTFYFGGDEVKAIQSGSTSNQGQQQVRRLDDVVPGSQGAANGQFLRTAWTQDPFSQGGYTNFRPGQLTEFGEFLYIESDDPDERQDVNIRNLIFAGEHLSDAFYGFMNGGAETGRLAANVIIRQVYGEQRAHKIQLPVAG
ncbi:MAG: NAD(P)/FAD-dependent oxidoreductase [Synechococcales bacterium]|nr:NAD(P)/FAD-dependent oxidoreductase [Synechococcales bacterium]